MRPARRFRTPTETRRRSRRPAPAGSRSAAGAPGVGGREGRSPSIELPAVSRDITVRAYDADDERWANELLETGLGGRYQARRGSLVDVMDADALVAERDGTPVGLLAFRPDGDDVELAALVVSEPGRGIGTALVEAFLVTAGKRRHRSAWVVTTNDNLDALRLYQRRGFRLAALRAGAVDEARRRLKPSIAPVAASGIPIRDELELTIDLRAMLPEGRPGR